VLVVAVLLCAGGVCPGLRSADLTLFFAVVFLPTNGEFELPYILQVLV
jgi:hypothetical protein